MIGTTLPDLRNRFLEGAGTLAESNKFIEAGLPSITSSLTFNIRASKNDINADWGVNGNRVMTNGGASTTAVPASKIGVSFSSNEIFGKSETVQPNAWTVRYYIRAK